MLPMMLSMGTAGDVAGRARLAARFATATRVGHVVMLIFRRIEHAPPIAASRRQAWLVVVAD